MAVLDAGGEIPGWKLVEGRSNRRWIDEGKAIEAMKAAGIEEDKTYTKKVITITAAEKIAGKDGKKLLSKAIIKPEGKPVLAPESDKRKAIAKTDFS